MTDHTQKPAAHGCQAGSDHDREVPEIDLLSPLTIRGITRTAGGTSSSRWCSRAG